MGNKVGVDAAGAGGEGEVGEVGLFAGNDLRHDQRTISDLSS